MANVGAPFETSAVAATQRTGAAALVGSPSCSRDVASALGASSQPSAGMGAASGVLLLLQLPKLLLTACTRATHTHTHTHTHTDTHLIACSLFGDCCATVGDCSSGCCSGYASFCDNISCDCGECLLVMTTNSCSLSPPVSLSHTQPLFLSPEGFCGSIGNCCEGAGNCCSGAADCVGGCCEGCGEMDLACDI